MTIKGMVQELSESIDDLKKSDETLSAECDAIKDVLYDIYVGSEMYFKRDMEILNRIITNR